jgi:hypothetical protein
VRPGAVAALLAFEAATLAVASSLRLSRLHDGGGSKPFDPVAAGTAEAILCVVLAAGAVLLARRGARARPAAVAATGIANRRLPRRPAVHDPRRRRCRRRLPRGRAAAARRHARAAAAAETARAQRAGVRP